MKIKLFEWEKLNDQQKITVSTGTSLFLIFFTFSATLFVLGINFRWTSLLIISFLVFVSGAYLSARFFRRAGQNPLKNIKSHLDNRLEINLKNQKENKIKRKSKKKHKPQREPPHTIIIPTDPKPIEKTDQSKDEEIRESMEE